MTNHHRTRLSGFTKAGYWAGRPLGWQVVWWIARNVVFERWWLPRGIRPALLRAFGAEVGSGAVIRHDVRIMWPWKLRLGANVWLGEGVRVINLEPIELGNDVCVSQHAILCCGSHDYQDPAFHYRNAPIVIESGAWIAAGALVGPGVTVGADAVVTLGTIVTHDVEQNGVLTAEPASVRALRYRG